MPAEERQQSKKKPPHERLTISRELATNEPRMSSDFKKPVARPPWKQFVWFNTIILDAIKKYLKAAFEMGVRARLSAKNQMD
jgi:hypothetical protein